MPVKLRWQRRGDHIHFFFFVNYALAGNLVMRVGEFIIFREALKASAGIRFEEEEDDYDVTGQAATSHDRTRQDATSQDMTRGKDHDDYSDEHDQNRGA